MPALINGITTLTAVFTALTPVIQGASTNVGVIITALSFLVGAVGAAGAAFGAFLTAIAGVIAGVVQTVTGGYRLWPR